MTSKWHKLASLAQEICTLWFQFFGAVFASKGYPFKNIFSQFTKRFRVLKRIVSEIKDENDFVTFCFYLVKILPTSGHFNIIIMFENMYVKWTGVFSFVETFIIGRYVFDVTTYKTFRQRWLLWRIG